MNDSIPIATVEKTTSVDTTTERLRILAQELGAMRGCSLASAARNLGMTARTLQRRLKTEGTSYRLVMDSVRLGLAQKWLSASWNVNEVSLGLGFSEPSAFFRALKRWAQTTPGRLRPESRSGQHPSDVMR